MYYGRKFVCDDSEKMNKLVSLYKTGSKRKRRFGNFTLSEDGTISHTAQEAEGYGDKRVINKLTDVIAIKLKGESGEVLLGNSAILPTVGSYSAYGHKKYNHTVTLIQRTLEQNNIVMIPFNAITQAGLNVKDIRIVEQAKSETVGVKETYWDKDKQKTRIVERHFTGASLFRVGDVYFLFDIDRREVEHNIFNPFIVQLPKAVNSIAEAYQSLKPKEVLQAEKDGVEVLRQGEWFLIAADKAPKVPKVTPLELLAITGMSWSNNRDMSGISKKDIARLTKLRDALPKQLSLQAGNNRPNTAEKGLKLGDVTYITGKLSHTGREHADLVLTKWYIAVPNTATKSFTVSGDID